MYMKTNERFTMNKRMLIAAMAVSVLGVAGCSSTGTNLSSGAQIKPNENAGTAIADQRLASSEFKRQGVRIIYSLAGNVEAIEVTGYAPVWGNSMNAARESYRAAELEAKKSLSDFVNKETISSTTSVRMISNNLEHAQDQNTNRFASNKSAELASSDDQVAGSTNPSTQENTATRNNAVKIAKQLNTTITTQNRGIIGGLYLKESGVIDDGRAVKVVMRWDRKHNDGRKQIRNLMAQ
jgi:outer membrane murein-binding lipoprotein Lpp